MQVTGRGCPPLASRFWLGSCLLLLAASSLPPLLDSLAPGRLGSPVGGLLGDYVASAEQMLLSSWVREYECSWAVAMMAPPRRDSS